MMEGVVIEPLSRNQRILNFPCIILPDCCGQAGNAGIYREQFYHLNARNEHNKDLSSGVALHDIYSRY